MGGWRSRVRHNRVICHTQGFIEACTGAVTKVWPCALRLPACVPLYPHRGLGCPYSSKHSSKWEAQLLRGAQWLASDQRDSLCGTCLSDTVYAVSVHASACPCVTRICRYRAGAHCRIGLTTVRVAGRSVL